MPRITIETRAGDVADSFEVESFTWNVHVKEPQTNTEAARAVLRIGDALREADYKERNGTWIPERPSEKAMRLAERPPLMKGHAGDLLLEDDSPAEDQGTHKLGKREGLR